MQKTTLLLLLLLCLGLLTQSSRSRAHSIHSLAFIHSFIQLSSFPKTVCNVTSSKISFVGEILRGKIRPWFRNPVEMDSAWVFSYNPNVLPQWVRQQPPATEVKKLKKLEVKVVMCCNTCVENVEEAVRGMHGVFDCKTDRWKDLLTIELTPYGGLDHDKLVRKLKKVTHDRKVEILDSTSSSREEKKSSSTTTTTIEYRNPFMGPGYAGGGLVPWPTSSASSSNPPFITNPFYLQHPVGCPTCMGYPGAVCANCGRGSELGARFY